MVDGPGGKRGCVPVYRESSITDRAPDIHSSFHFRRIPGIQFAKTLLEGITERWGPVTSAGEDATDDPSRNPPA
jgi:hypothetical protein